MAEASRSYQDELPALDPDVAEAQGRFERCQNWERDFQVQALGDLKFAEADSYNGYQWPNSLRVNRDVDKKPCLTINITRQHNLNIINDMKQNKPAIAVRGVGNGATKESADIWQALMRHIEYRSNASTVYDHGATNAVRIGIGYWRVMSEHVTNDATIDAFNQELVIKRIPDPLAVFMDPDAKEADKSDARFAFLFEDVNRKEFKELYPQYKDYDSYGGTSALGSDGWINSDSIRLCEYYRMVEESDTLWAEPETGGVLKQSELTPELVKSLKAQGADSRKIRKRKVEWLFIIGEHIVDRKWWPGSIIPVVPIIGEENIIEGRLDRKGHTRALLDAQRMYNYMSSTAVEYGALQTKTPWLIAKEAIEGSENQWAEANTVNAAYLEYKAFRDDFPDQPNPQPSRVQPPVSANAAMDGMQTARNEMMMASGQYQAQLGAQGNERSGKAIQERQRQGDRATYHYIDNQAIAIRKTGRILLEVIPAYYDTKRTMRIIAEDKTDFEIDIDPSAQQPFMQYLNHQGEVAKRILNPQLGRYEVQADVGPGYATKREEAWNAFTLMLTQAPQLTAIIGDLMLQSGDFPLSQEAAARLRRMVPPMALGKGPTQTEQQLGQENQQLKTLLQQLMEELSVQKIKLKGHGEKRDIEAFNADTTRLKVIGDHWADSHLMAQAAIKLRGDLQANGIQDTSAAASAEATGRVNGAGGGQDALPGMDMTPVGGLHPAIPGARRAPDGQYYVPDSNRPGKFARVDVSGGQGG